MALKPGKTEVKKLVPVMDAEYASVEDAAAAVLAAAWELYEAKAKFFVAGQLRIRDGKRVRSWDPKQERVVLGPFATERQARDAAGGTTDGTLGGLQYNKAAAPLDEFHTWVVPYHAGTVQSFHQDRKARREKEQADLANELTQAQRLSADTEEAERAKPQCEFLTINDDLDVVQCIRRSGHPAACFAQYPESWGLVYRDGVTAIREQQEEA